ncbi:MAG: hypothetical protein J0H31_12585 [Alphaproteobacteria bacterium]|nr:hypothetical protein [Alphaproteobacteria bacterium]
MTGHAQPADTVIDEKPGVEDVEGKAAFELISRLGPERSRRASLTAARTSAVRTPARSAR